MMSGNEEIFDAERQVLARLADALLGDEQLATDVFGAPVSEVELHGAPGPLAPRISVRSTRWYVRVGRYPAG
jgi:hypothetical protein